MPRNLSQWRLLEYPAQRNDVQQQNIVAICKLFSFLFDSNDVSTTIAFEKISVTGDGSNNSGIWGQSHQPPEANEGLGAEPYTPRRFFQIFFQKIKHFYAYFGLNFCLKTCF